MAYSILRDRLLGTALAATAVIGSLVSGAALLASKAEAAEASPLFVEAVAAVHPVEASDGSTHLIYELLVVNHGMVAVSIDSIETIGTAGELLQTTAGDDLRAHARQSPLGGDGTTLQPADSGLIFMDVVLPDGTPLPQEIGHVFNATLSSPEAGGSASFGGGLTMEAAEVAASVSFRVADVSIDATPAVVLSAPVRGDNWVIFRGCCDLANSHRGITSFAGGSIQIAERFAIDFVQTNDDGLMISGPGNELSSYVYLGAEILAVADGTVVAARNDQPNQTPGALPTDVADDVAGGNAVVLDIGDGRYVFYGHMMPGSVTVEAGDVVKAGDPIGRLGNSGRSLGPHLHFHVMDNADWQLGDGVPYVFDRFAGQGVLADGALMMALQGQAAEIAAGRLSGPHGSRHPLNNQLIDFGN